MRRSPGNLTRHELIGLEVTVARSDCPQFNGMSGVVVDETMKTLSVRTPAGVKMIPKKGKIFNFHLNEFDKSVDGNSILGRPQDRTKMR